MSSNDDTALGVRYPKAAGRSGDFAVADELVAEDAAFHDPGVFAGSTRSAHQVVDVEGEVGEGADQLLPAALIGVTNGGPVEHAGGPRRPLAGVAPTGRELAVAGITIYRTSDGRIAEAWSSYDELGMLEQLGIAVFGGGGDGDGDGDDMTRTPLSA